MKKAKVIYQDGSTNEISSHSGIPRTMKLAPGKFVLELSKAKLIGILIPSYCIYDAPEGQIELDWLVE